MSRAAAPPFEPVGAVFDLDGLLVDSEEPWGRAERRVVDSYGRPWDPAIREQMLGTGPLDAARILADHLGVDDPAAVRARLLEAIIDEFAAGIPPRRGAADLVAALGARVPLAVATNSERLLAEHALTSSGLAAAFTAVVCVDDVARAKPAPDVYLTACKLLGAPPSACVAFEDSPVGAEAAASAGLWVLGCPSLPGSVLASADVTVASLAGVRPAFWFAPDAGEGSAG